MFWENKIIREDLEEIYSRNIDWEKLKGKTIFITGAYGMLASYLVFQCIYLNEIVHYGMKLVLAVRSEEKARKRFGDFLDKEYMVLYLEDINEPIHYDGRVDYIIHGASLASTQYYDTIPIEVMLPNILGTIQLLRFAEKKDAEGFLLWRGLWGNGFFCECDYRRLFRDTFKLVFAKLLWRKQKNGGNSLLCVV